MDGEREPELISMGAVAAGLGVSSTTVKALEKRGVIPAGRRVNGSNARVWPAGELEVMQRRVAERRASRTKETVAASAA